MLLLPKLFGLTSLMPASLAFTKKISVVCFFILLAFMQSFVPEFFMIGRKSFVNFNIGCIALVMSLMQLSVSAQAGVIYTESWEDGKIVKPSLSFEGNCYNAKSHGYNSMELTKSKVRAGNYALRTEAKGYHKNNVCKLDYLVKEAKTRNEIRFMSNTDKGLFKHGSEHWFTTSYYFPSNEGDFSSWWPNGSKSIIFQLLGAGNSFTPEVHFMIGSKGRLEIEMSSSVTERELLKVEHKYTTIQPDKWVDVVVHWKRSWKSDGILQIWVDGDLIVNKSGPNAIRDKPYAVAKAGFYFGKEIRPFDYVMYMDNFQIADGNSNYSQVASSKPAAASDASPLPLPPANLKVSVY